MSDQNNEKVNSPQEAQVDVENDSSSSSSSNNEKLMAEQEARLMLRTGGKLPEKPTNKLIKRDRKFFDSADYVIAGKNKAQARQPAVTQLIKKKGVIEAFPKPSTTAAGTTEKATDDTKAEDSHKEEDKK